MRTLLWVLTICPYWALGQAGWSLSLDPVSSKVLVTDAVEMPTGDFAVAVVAPRATGEPGSPPTSSWVAFISPSGTMGNMDLIPMEQDWSLYVSDLEQRPGGDLLTVGSARHEATSSSNMVLVHAQGSLGAFTPILSQQFGDTLHLWDLSSTLGQDGLLYLTGSLQPTGALTPSRLLLLRADPDTGVINYRIAGEGGGFRVGRCILPADSSVLVPMFGSLEEGPLGYSTINRFNMNFDFLDGFPLTSMSGTGMTGPVDSVIHDVMFSTKLSGDTLLVSGRFGTIFPMGMRAAMVRLAPDGTYAGLFLPRSQYTHDFVGARQSHDMTPEGKVVFAMVENFFTGPPDPVLGTWPSRIHVYRLDTLLNVECEYIVDGFETNTYYFLTRIKATSDGGLLLMGSSRNLGTMEEPQGWIMKLGPEQCLPLAVEEVAMMHGINVFPNPGTDGFTLVLNGPPVQGARMELLDTMGQVVRQGKLDQSVMDVATDGLAPGMYLYRVTDRLGHVLGSGRWVKQ